MNKKITVKVNVNRSDIDSALDKCNLLYVKIQEIKALADELSSCISDMSLEVKQ